MYPRKVHFCCPLSCCCGRTQHPISNSAISSFCIRLVDLYTLSPCYHHEWFACAPCLPETTAAVAEFRLQHRQRAVRWPRRRPLLRVIGIEHRYPPVKHQLRNHECLRQLHRLLQDSGIRQPLLHCRFHLRTRPQSLRLLVSAHLQKWVGPHMHNNHTSGEHWKLCCIVPTAAYLIFRPQSVLMCDSFSRASLLSCSNFLRDSLGTLCMTLLGSTLVQILA